MTDGSRRPADVSRLQPSRAVAARIERGRELMREHRDLLERVAAEYGVQPRFIVALWGIEQLRQLHRRVSVVGALATLAYEGRRAAFFRKELPALRIVDQGDVAPAQMMGSWAGAMGQSQFMPSSYLAHAVDYDGDGRRDIWSTHADIFASIANYLAKAGWNSRHTWGAAGAAAGQAGGLAAGLDVVRPLPEWHALGIRRATGTTCRWWRSTPRCCRWTTAPAHRTWCTTTFAS